MSFANDILDAIEIMVKQVVEDNSTKIYTGVCKTTGVNNCVLTINGKDNTVKYYGGVPVVGTVYQVFIPFGNMSAAFIIVPGAGGQDPETGVSSVNGKTGAVVLTASDVGELPNTTTIPTKTSQLDNDSGFIDSSVLDGYAKTTDIPTETSQLINNSGFITANDVPVKSVDGSTGTVVTNAVKTTSQSLTDAQKAQARTNIGAGTSSFDGDYESLSNKPTIPTKVSQLENDSNYATKSQVNAKYTKPTTGIPKTDLASDVQGSLDKADTALQSAPVTSVNTKTGAVTLVKSDIGLSNVDNVKQYSANNPPPYPVTSVNKKTGAVVLDASDVNAVAKTGDTMTGTLRVGSASLETNGYVTGTWLKTTAENALNKKPTKIAVLDGGLVYSRTPAQIKSDIGLSKVANVKQYSASNPPPYPVTSVNGQTGAVTIESGGVAIVTQSTQPSGQKIGDFWYQVT